MRTLTKTALAAVVSMSMVLPALAQGSSSSLSTSAGVAASTDLACMSAAVDTREAASISARSTFNASIMAALDVRRAALKAAYTIANNNDRRVAIQAALTAYANATATARAKFSTDVKAAHTVFKTAKVACHIDQGEARLTKEQKKHDNDNDNDHQNRGLHLGWLKNSVNAKAWANGHLKLDLSN